MKKDKKQPCNIGHYDIKTHEFMREWSKQGRIYKDYDAFNAKSKKVCYIPELFDTKYSYFDFLKIAKGNRGIAIYLFETVDWQSPGALYDELIFNGEVKE